MNIGLSLRALGKKLLGFTMTGVYPQDVTLPQDEATIRLWEEKLGVKREYFTKRMNELVAEASARINKYKAAQRREQARARRRRGGNRGSLAKKRAKSRAGLIKRKSRWGRDHNRVHHLGRKATRSKGSV